MAVMSYELGGYIFKVMNIKWTAPKSMQLYTPLRQLWRRLHCHYTLDCNMATATILDRN